MPNRIPEEAKTSKTIRCLWILKYLGEGPIHSTELAVLFETTTRGYVLKAPCVMPF